ncbi:hypothetical protein LEN_0155 [Lysobacter enzymogenes]|uniref:Secreted protein n=1 Tax=Lysobacter enzymogenes TaxID=69 RepID=A0AAU9AC77_LYSEN|nr:hypothetical protein LEN_0155 [Lysobacter enzymogenes]
MKPWIPAFAGMTFLQVARATAVSRFPERIETHKLANEPAIPCRSGASRDRGTTATTKVSTQLRCRGRGSRRSYREPIGFRLAPPHPKSRSRPARLRLASGLSRRSRSR